MNTREGIAIVLSAASGTGKTTLGHRLMKEFSDIALSVSYTTRAPRGAERDGVDYHFVSASTFQDMVQHGAFIEWAQVHGNLYGTAWNEVQSKLDTGTDVLLDIDVQGGAGIKQRLSNGLLIFLLPPSMEELRRRLASRGTESDEQVQIRLLNARREIEASKEYDYLVVNDELDHAVRTLCEIVRSERLRRSNKTQLIGQLLKTRAHP